ncbi:hypothetical protein METBIDRAFT_44285 [Metschnikowia bicuspidata var. bicuspidata NRRL YB-4993]|uniref:Protein ARV n=1 Tax=Metschnikowia bicuspidata var. bicuspidata NRRL YB-4993 TaxID=869754 RepID=A0A1A0H918_9ASCO|nr:hypothetical protein METBIDRAFT_44285 [Metschnikowia bicuspidata var. bicuspidata NRRL YB-4993]OBA20619.1 hypothetical protein METBIDRAFT_44285 [Metschnikowia bicuspidata var. bicuspidata NRRL YB-4993]
MICVECTNPEITCLHSEYKSKYVQLTVCPRCGNFADRYIEFDNVILFLDLVLLRPQAYRHVAFNVVEQTLFAGAQPPGVFRRYRKLARFFLLSVLFEVYLKWAYEEKSTPHTLLKARVLAWLPVWQYSFFVCQQMAEKTVFFSLVLVLFMWASGSAEVVNSNLQPPFRRAYYLCVLILTLLMSLAVKCLPILMLIWPYDNATVASMAVDVLSVFNTIEALHINTRCSYATTICIIAVSMLVLMVAKQLATSHFVAFLSPDYTWLQLFKHECLSFQKEVCAMAAAFSPVAWGTF